MMLTHSGSLLAQQAEMHPSFADESLVWVAPESLFVVENWHAGKGDHAQTRTASGSDPVELANGQLGFVPVERGQWVAVESSGGTLQLGLGTGEEAVPDAIVWEPEGITRVYVPHWSRARYVAIRASASIKLSVNVSAQATSPVDWFLWDCAVSDWARSGTKLPFVPNADAQRILQLLAGLRNALSATERPQAAPLLLSLWLEESLRVRPLTRPFFVSMTPADGAAERVLVAPTRAHFDTPAADVHRWQLRAKGVARVIIRENGAIARVINWSKPGRVLDDWTPTQTIRTVAAPAGPSTELEVVHGTVSVAMQASAYRPEYREQLGFARRQRVVLQSEAAASSVTPHRLTSLVHEYSHYTASLRATTLDQGILEAMAGLRQARQHPWQALFAQRLFDLAVDDSAPELRTMPLGPVANTISAPDREPVPTRQTILGLALQQAVSPSRLGRRPALGEPLESLSRANPSDTLIQRVSAKYWGAFPFRSVSPPASVTTRPAFVPFGSQGYCNPTRDGVEAWLIPADGLTDFTVDLEPNVYAMVTLRPIDNEPRREGLVHFDGIPVTIHSAAGLSSRVAFGRGQHRIKRLANAPRFAVEATAGMSLPCKDLYRWQRLTPISPHTAVRFDLPGPFTPSVARIRVDSPPSAARLWVTLGATQREVTVRPPASGAVDVAVGAEDTTLSISAAQPIAIALSIKREADPEPKPVSIPIASLTKERSGTIAPRPLSPSQLVEVEALGRLLRSSTDSSESSRLRSERARLLIGLGYSSLALRDIEALPAADETKSDLIRLDGMTAPTLAIGLLATMAPLALPEDDRTLRVRRTAFHRSDPAACALDLEQLAASPADAETLLAGYCAERVGLSHAAAALFERVARNSNHGPTMLHAAQLMADAALVAHDKHLGLNAAILGTWVTNWGTDAGALQARLDPAIKWVTPSVLEGAAGVALLARGLAEIPSNRQQLLGRLVDAPKHSLVVEQDEFAELLVNGHGSEALEVASGCDVARQQAPCKLNAWLDNAPIHCGDSHAPASCRLPVSAGKHRVRFSFDGPGSIGWVGARYGQQALFPTIASSWSVLEADVPAHLTILGPTIIRVRSRGSGNERESLGLSGCGLDEGYRRLSLPTGTDPQLRPWPSNSEATAVGNALDLSIPLPEARRCRLSIVAHQVHTLVQIALARADGLPLPRSAPPEEPGATPGPSAPYLPGVHLASPSVVPRRVAERQPLLIGTRARFVSESLAVALEQDTTSGHSEAAFQDVFGELSAIAARELVANRWWGTLQAGARLRHGPTTEFARVSLDLVPQAGLFGVDLLGSVYSQSSGDVRTTTYATTGKLSRLWPLTPSMNLLPQVGFTTLHLGEAPSSTRGVDGDVYSRFYASHPRYASLATTLATRPFVDTLLNLSLSTRSLPQLDGLDRLTGSVELMSLPISNWPLLGAIDWMSSYRPASALRSEMFVRHDFGLAFSFWQWLTPNERLRFFGRIDLFFDAPAASFGNAILAPTVGLELTSSGARGLRDLSPQQAPFREFQERGSARVRTGRVGELEEPLGLGAGQ